MINYCKEDLQEVRKMILSLKEEQYQFKSALLSGASIGQHIRHILEFYLCLLNGRKNQVVNYDNRERNVDLETNPAFAIYTIDKICSNFLLVLEDPEFFLEGSFSSDKNKLLSIKTSINRELAYCLEHSIHHQALIKIGLKEQNIENFIGENFGVAPATIRHNQKCAQ